ncbi:MAG: PQQ-dependent sugar dehydrogenase [Acidimicrobiia bacterium]|nr:PQQ-dependent sugar dehydrogenase [Acidimicrobiia bacterium]
MRFLSLAVALGLLTAACSGNDSTEPTVAAVPSTTVQPTTTTTAAVVTTEARPATAATTSTTTTTTTTQPPPELLGVELVLFAAIDWPLAIAAPHGDSRLFVAHREGRIEVVGAGGEVQEDPFLDLSDRVRANGIEQGLLGLAFHPSYADNGRFYVYFSDENDDTRLAEYTVGSDPAFADPGSYRELMLFDQPTERHNAGMLEFGPDGYLYVAVGDGGDGGHNGQKSDTLFGTILRIDVDGGEPYAVPGDNPFVDGGGAPEVWAYGLRNPWRFSIDAESNSMFIADVGQQDWEEVNVVSLDQGGANFGWAYREGSRCFSHPECEETETVLPVVEYGHSDGCSITGGYVYRGADIPELNGTYFYSDWCTGWIRSFRYEGGAAVDVREWPELDPGQVNTFGVDGFGELYIGTWGGDVWKLVPIRAET